MTQQRAGGSQMRPSARFLLKWLPFRLLEETVFLELGEKEGVVSLHFAERWRYHELWKGAGRANNFPTSA